VDNTPHHDELPAADLGAALRALVVDSGPTVRKLVNNESDGSRVIMGAAATPPSWSVEEKASVVLAIIADVIEEQTNRRWKRTAQAAFRLPAQRFQAAEFDSLNARWRELGREDAEREGGDVDAAAEKYRGYWRNSAAPNLARDVLNRFAQLNTTGGWQRYRQDESYAAPAMLPMSFERSEVLYQFEGRRGVQSTNQRWLRAHGPVDHFEAVGWYYNDPDADVEIIPLANCELDGEYATLPQGGRTARLRFSHMLQAEEPYYFAYQTRFNSEKECRPTILNEVRGHRTDLLTVRAQFDPVALTLRCWHFDVSVQSEGWRVPPDGAAQLLAMAPNGYVEHEFRNCQHGRKYGLRWTW
jgi:hypothetical protein